LYALAQATTVGIGGNDGKLWEGNGDDEGGEKIKDENRTQSQAKERERLRTFAFGGGGKVRLWANELK
jgi:hypothetical protein